MVFLEATDNDDDEFAELTGKVATRFVEGLHHPEPVRINDTVCIVVTDGEENIHSENSPGRLLSIRSSQSDVASTFI